MYPGMLLILPPFAWQTFRRFVVPDGRRIESDSYERAIKGI